MPTLVCGSHSLWFVHSAFVCFLLFDLTFTDFVSLTAVDFGSDFREPFCGPVFFLFFVSSDVSSFFLFSCKFTQGLRLVGARHSGTLIRFFLVDREARHTLHSLGVGFEMLRIALVIILFFPKFIVLNTANFPLTSKTLVSQQHEIKS
eukprot:c19373_g1_i2.p1 GENE.c19373_g1_i2~~c19373_g1_i2.p1  ORF type:complete len:148 (+),score=15.19 c19373_g1_i2:1178-1621(+)